MCTEIILLNKLVGHTKLTLATTIQYVLNSQRISDRKVME